MRIQENGRKHRDSEPLGRVPFYDESIRHSSTYRDKRQESRVPSRKYHDETLPSQHLWVGNVSTSVTEMTLAEQFSRFGDIESLKLYSTKNYAFVTLNTVEDAMYAKKGLHGAVLGGLAIRIEFVKGDGKVNKQYPVNQEEKGPSCAKSPKDDKAMIKDKRLEDSEASRKKDTQANINVDTGYKQTPEKSRGNKSGEPSEVLWIGFPLHLRIDDRKLHKLFAPFGGVEKITTFPGRTYAFVRFQNVKSASRAKDALQGKLFDDPRVSISFAKSEVGSVDHNQASSKVSLSLPTEVRNTTIRHTFPESSSGKGEARMKEFPHPATETRDPTTSIPKFGSPSNLQGDSINSKMRGSSYSNSRFGTVTNETKFPRVSPMSKEYFGDASGNRLIPNNEWRLNPNIRVNTEMPNRDGQQSSKATVLEWSEGEIGIMKQKRHRIGGDYLVDEPSSKLGYNELKRQRLDNNQHIQKDIQNNPLWEGNLGMYSLWDTEHTHEDVSNNSQIYWGGQDVQVAIPPKHVTSTKGSCDEAGNMGSSLTIPFSGPDLDHGRGSLDKNEFSMTPIPPPSIDVQPSPKELFRWEGTIAKGGTVVCHCRCFPATKEINIKFPDILNCTARTSLDMLAQYIMQVKSFAVVIFMPQGVVDVKPYQELMAFLADKKRAAVCKLSDEDTLFLVPPSDFIEEFLKVPKSNNILGVVLGQQQFLSEVHQPLSDQTMLSQHDKALKLDDLKELSYQQLNFNTTSEHPFINPCVSEPSLTAGPDKKLIGSLSHGKAVDNRVLFHGPVSDSNRMAYPMQVNHLISDGNKVAYQHWQNGPMQQDIHGSGKSNTQIKIQAPKDIANPTLQSEMIMSSEEQSKPILSYSQTRITVDSQNMSVPSPFHDQSSLIDSAMQHMKFTPIVQPPLSLAQSHQFIYNSQPPFSNNLTYDGQQGPWAVPSNYTSKPVPQAGNLQLSPPLPPSLFTVEAPLHTGGDKQTMIETEEHKMIQISQERSTVENPGQSESQEGQKKFQATLELAAALLQQLQKQTKL